jgi:hypothetical protein
MPSGEMRVQDPDGYVVFVAHWPDAVHEKWEAERKRKQDAGEF